MMKLFKEAAVVGYVTKELPGGMVEVNYGGTTVVLPKSDNELLLESGGSAIPVRPSSRISRMGKSYEIPKIGWHFTAVKNLPSILSAGLLLSKANEFITEELGFPAIWLHRENPVSESESFYDVDTGTIGVFLEIDLTKIPADKVDDLGELEGALLVKEDIPVKAIKKIIAPKGLTLKTSIPVKFINSQFEKGGKVVADRTEELVNAIFKPDGKLFQAIRKINKGFPITVDSYHLDRNTRKGLLSNEELRKSYKPIIDEIRKIINGNTIRLYRSKDIRYPDKSITSWSLKREIAESFSEGRKVRFYDPTESEIVTKDIPVENILAISNTLYEPEFMGKKWSDEPQSQYEFIVENAHEIPAFKQRYYTTWPEPYSLDQFIETEVKERRNYTLRQVKKWVEKYKIPDGKVLIWVATTPQAALTYLASAESHYDVEMPLDEFEKKYNVDREWLYEYTEDDGVVIKESDDGDNGYLMLLKDKKLEAGGALPEHYRKMGFKKTGQKMESTRPGKKWMVLAKKGDQFKVVHGGAKGMEDFTQHRDEERRKRFWQRMGGSDSEKTKDPFSPLYWHKKFGTWESGGVLPKGTIKVAWVDAEHPEIMESRMYDNLKKAIKENEDKLFLVFELEDEHDDYYKWRLLPYGAYGKYEKILGWGNTLGLLEKGGVVNASRKLYHGVKNKESVDNILKNGLRLSEIKPQWNNDYAISALASPGAVRKYFGKREIPILEIQFNGVIADYSDVKHISGVNAKDYTRNILAAGIDAVRLGGSGAQYFIYNTDAIKSVRLYTHADGGEVEVATEIEIKSYLTPELQKIVRSDNFKNWFGDWENDAENASKMVDDNGEPLVCYHGTANDFSVFEKRGHVNDLGFYGSGFYFTFQKGKYQKWAKSEAAYYGKKIIPVFINTRKPFDISKLSTYKGHSINYIGTESLIFLLNVALKFPQLANKIFIKKRVRNNETEHIMDAIYDIVDVPISVLPPLFDYYSSKLKTYEVDDDGKISINGSVKSEQRSYTDKTTGITDTWMQDDDLNTTGGFKKGDFHKDVMEAFFIASAIERYDGIDADYFPEGYMTRNPEITDAIRQAGYDSIIQSEYGDEICVFDSKQIKIADGTNTTFDVNSSNIRLERGGFAKTFLDYIPINRRYEISDSLKQKTYDQLLELLQDSKQKYDRLVQMRVRGGDTLRLRQLVWDLQDLVNAHEKLIEHNRKIITVNVPLSSSVIWNAGMEALGDLNKLSDDKFLNVWKNVNAANYMFRNSMDVSDYKHGKNSHVLHQAGSQQNLYAVNAEFKRRKLDRKYTLFIDIKKEPVKEITQTRAKTIKAALDLLDGKDRIDLLREIKKEIEVMESAVGFLDNENDKNLVSTEIGELSEIVMDFRNSTCATGATEIDYSKVVDGRRIRSKTKIVHAFDNLLHVKKYLETIPDTDKSIYPTQVDVGGQTNFRIPIWVKDNGESLYFQKIESECPFVFVSTEQNYEYVGKS